MLPCLAALREFTVLSVLLRLLLAVLCGGAIGVEREYKQCAAGFRTHILICLGAAITTLTSQYLVLGLHLYTDIARLGAQVIAGVGFIGAGTIVVTQRQRIKGLTTAAGLWAVACIGLAVGAGFFEGAIIGTILVLIAEKWMATLEKRILRASPKLDLYLEYQGRHSLDSALDLLHSGDIAINSTQINRCRADEQISSALLTLSLPKGTDAELLLSKIRSIGGVTMAETL